MVKIRLRRIGAKSKPAYRIVVADSRAPRDGAFIEVIGHYNPLSSPESVVLDQEKISKWLKFGAEPTATVERLLANKGIIPRKERVYSSKPKKKAEQKAEEGKAIEGAKNP